MGQTADMDEKDKKIIDLVVAFVNWQRETYGGGADNPRRMKPVEGGKAWEIEQAVIEAGYSLPVGHKDATEYAD